jgi:integrase
VRRPALTLGTYGRVTLAAHFSQPGRAPSRVQVQAVRPGAPQVHPWSADEARTFLAAAADDPLYPAFLLLLLYGLRRGEVLGLRWVDVDQENNEIHIRQQIHRANGELRIGPVMTSAGRRDLSLLTFASEALPIRLDVQAADHAELGRAWQGSGLIFTTKTGRPIEPRNLVRSFQRICSAHGLRVIKVHHLRHTTATLLKNLGVPARDAQLILGHSRMAVTQEIYRGAVRGPACLFC